MAQLAGFHARFGLPQVTCRVCLELNDPLHTWCQINPARQSLADKAPPLGMALVRLPPAQRRGGTGQIQVRIDNEPVADVDFALCQPCDHRAILEQIRVDSEYRHQGLGRLLISAALVLAPVPPWTWSTTRVVDDLITRAFWAAVPLPSLPTTEHGPRRCRHMTHAAERLPDP